MIQNNKRSGCSLISLGCVWGVIGIGVLAALFSLIHIPVNLWTMLGGCTLLVIAGALIKRKNRISIRSFIWNWKEIISYIIVIAFVAGLSIYHFGWTLQLNYIDIDSSRYLREAMQFIRTESVSGEYLSTLIVSLFIRFVAFFLPAAKWYKGMILAHIFMQILSGCMFLTLAYKLNNSKSCWTINTICTILFISGFQLYVLTYCTFFHWQDGAIMIMFMMFYLLELQQAESFSMWSVIGFLAGAFGLCVDYPFFWIISIPMVLPEILVWGKNHYSELGTKNKCTIFISAIMICSVGVIFALQRSDSVDALFKNLQSDGVIYKEPFMDFVFFIPLLIIYYILLNKENNRGEKKTVLRMSVMLILFMVVWATLHFKNQISSYYFYRNYYVLWLIAWLMVVHVMKLLIKEKQQLFIAAYGGIYLLLVIVTVTNANLKLWDKDNSLFLQKPTNSGICSIFAFNANTLANPAEPAVSPETLALYDYVIENLNDQNVPMFSSYYTYMLSSWYMAITNVYQENTTCDLQKLTVYDVLKQMDEIDANYCLVQKSDSSWMKYYDDVLAKADVVFETEDGYILTKNTESWMELLNEFSNTSDQQLELFQYMRANFAPQHIRVLYEKKYKGQNEAAYTAYTGEGATDYIGKITEKNLMKKLAILDEDQVDCLVIFKDSKMYQDNKEYFDSQYIAYENEAGMLLGAADGTWAIEE